MSWVISDSITLESSQIKRVERRKNKNSESNATFDWERQRPIDSSTVQSYRYILVTKDGKEFELSKEDFVNIRKQLNTINERDVEFLNYIRDHLEFNPGTEAFEEVQNDFFGRSNRSNSRRRH